MRPWLCSNDHPREAGGTSVTRIARTVCHSQLHELNGSLNEPLPMVLGHEGTGVVMAVGAH